MSQLELEAFEALDRLAAGSAARRSTASAPWSTDMPMARPADIAWPAEATKDGAPPDATTGWPAIGSPAKHCGQGRVKLGRVLGNQGFQHQLVGLVEGGADAAA